MGMKQKLMTGLVALASAGAFAADVSPRLRETQDAWQRHIDAWTQRDVPAILADYSNDALILVNGRRFEGKEAIGRLFRNFFAVFDRAQRHVIDPATVEEGMIYISWNALIEGKEHPFGTDTFVVEDGKIRYQTVTSDAEIFAGFLPPPA